MVVSVVIITYNHEAYIAQAIEGALMQKTNFPFEIIIGEDESSDGTRAICQAYQKKYPDKIRLFLRSRKDVIYIGGQATGRYNLMRSFEVAQGKYVAFCEGDDYWTDPYKLQRQVDFLEKNPDYSFCFTNVNTYRQNTGEFVKNTALAHPLNRDTFDIYYTIANGFYLSTCTLLFRNNFKLPAWYAKILAGDKAMALLLVEKGKGYYFKEATACYRYHKGGISKGPIFQSIRNIYFHYKQDILLFENFNTYTQGKYQKEIYNRLKYTRIRVKFRELGRISRWFFILYHLPNIVVGILKSDKPMMNTKIFIRYILSYYGPLPFKKRKRINL